jgi:hypothetical protein
MERASIAGALLPCDKLAAYKRRSGVYLTRYMANQCYVAMLATQRECEAATNT